MDIDWWFLCQPSENRDDRKVGALFSAVRSNDVEKVQLGLTKGVPVDCVDEMGWTPLARAVKAGSVPVARLLLKHGASLAMPTADGVTLASLAATEDMLDLLRSFDPDAGWIYADDGSKSRRRPEASASSTGVIAGVSSADRAGVPARNNTANLGVRLSEAAFFGDYDTLKAMLDGGANVNVRDQSGMTPLAWAANKGGMRLVELLLDRGADVNCRNSDGWTPLHWAARSGNVDIAKVLLQAGADKNLKNLLGRTAAQMADNEAVRMLFVLQQPEAGLNRNLSPASESESSSSTGRMDQLLQQQAALPPPWEGVAGAPSTNPKDVTQAVPLRSGKGSAQSLTSLGSVPSMSHLPAAAEADAPPVQATPPSLPQPPAPPPAAGPPSPPRVPPPPPPAASVQPQVKPPPPPQTVSRGRVYRMQTTPPAQVSQSYAAAEPSPSTSYAQPPTWPSPPPASVVLPFAADAAALPPSSSPQELYAQKLLLEQQVAQLQAQLQQAAQLQAHMQAAEHGQGASPTMLAARSVAEAQERAIAVTAQYAYDSTVELDLPEESEDALRQRFAQLLASNGGAAGAWPGGAGPRPPPPMGQRTAMPLSSSHQLGPRGAARLAQGGAAAPSAAYAGNGAAAAAQEQWQQPQPGAAAQSIYAAAGFPMQTPDTQYSPPAGQASPGAVYAQGPQPVPFGALPIGAVPPMQPMQSLQQQYTGDSSAAGAAQRAPVLQNGGQPVSNGPQPVANPLLQPPPKSPLFAPAYAAGWAVGGTQPQNK